MLLQEPRTKLGFQNVELIKTETSIVSYRVQAASGGYKGRQGRDMLLQEPRTKLGFLNAELKKTETGIQYNTKYRNQMGKSLVSKNLNIISYR